MSSNRWIGILLSTALAASSGSLLAADAQGIRQKMDSERISLDLKEARAKQLLTLYKDLLGVEVDYQCAQDNPVTLSFENLKVRTSLDAVCESAGLEWTLVEGTPAILRFTCASPPPEGQAQRRVVKVEERGGPPTGGEPQARAEVKVRKTMGDQGQKNLSVSINLKDAELADAIKMAARLLEAKLVMDSSFEGKKVTIKMDEVPISAFLDAVCKQSGASWQLKAGDPPVLEVGKRS